MQFASIHLCIYIYCQPTYSWISFPFRIEQKRVKQTNVLLLIQLKREPCMHEKTHHKFENNLAVGPLRYAKPAAHLLKGCCAHAKLDCHSVQRQVKVVAQSLTSDCGKWPPSAATLFEIANFGQTLHSRYFRSRSRHPSTLASRASSKHV